MQKLLFIASTRIPTERAMGVAIMKQCEAFARAGLTVELVVPKRHNEHTDDSYHYHDVAPVFSIRYLWSLDLTLLGIHPIRFLLQKATFFISLCFYLARTKVDILYTREILFVAPLITHAHKFVELHHLYGLRFFGTFFLGRMDGIITITEALREDVVRLFNYQKPIVVAPSGVDVDAFEKSFTELDSRAHLGIVSNLPVIMYIGALEEWKGYRTFLGALRLLTGQVQGVVIGGTPIQLDVLQKEYPEVLFLGTLPQRDLPRNQRAADVLVVPNSAREMISARHTSPLKIFAHMASNVPIVASAVPSIAEILSSRNAFIVAPDDPADLARGITEAFSNRAEAIKRSTQAAKEVLQYDWSIRTNTILAYIESVDPRYGVAHISHIPIDAKNRQQHLEGTDEKAKRVYEKSLHHTRNKRAEHILTFFMKYSENLHSIGGTLVRNTTRTQIIVFIFVGSWVAVFNYVSFYLSYAVIGFPYMYASIISFVLTVFMSYFSQKNITFRNVKVQKGKTVRHIGLFYANALLGLFLNTCIMIVGVDYLQLSPYVSQGISIAVLASYNFFIYRLILTK